MKISTNLSFSKTLILLLLCIATFSSCKKNDPNVVVKGEAKVKMVNAVETEVNQDVYVDGYIASASALGFGETSNYLKISSGSRSVKFMGSNNFATDAVINYTPSITYTTFLVSDKLGNREIMNFEDNLSNAESGKAKIKLLNLTPNFITGINVSVQAGTQFVNGLLYKDASNYFTVEPGINLRYNVVGSGSIKTIDGTSLEAGKIYTIWFSGNTAATLQAHLITDN